MADDGRERKTGRTGHATILTPGPRPGRSRAGASVLAPGSPRSRRLPGARAPVAPRRENSPVTVAGPHRNRTGFLRTPCLVCP
ncbi:hypothetical protein UO65_0546 [Actinokineospora spheciospongiae]|uniref:Uncharacterized protein n=1 Tax=Actinokineospora spheciospongiae TaxID=909613 RepID=W7JDP1_9PSEU|nr:hypothetical protein UO65_0546 [Actinokineospora spheciospongiae]